MKTSHALLHRLGWIGLVLTKLATIGFVLEAVIWPHQPKYKGKGMRIRSVAYFGGLAAIPAAWLSGNLEGEYPVAADLALTTPLLIDAAGNSLGIYDAARIDDAVHFLNAAVLSSLFGAVISSHVSSRNRAAAATLAFGLIGEAAFDAMEYTADRIGFSGLGLSNEDTIADTAMAALGTLVATAATWARWQPQQPGPEST